MRSNLTETTNLVQPDIKRIYDPVEESDGTRILVDRLWPRGVSKKSACLDLWLREIAPSPALRKWFNHDPGRWDVFRQRYQSELQANSKSVDEVLAMLRDGQVTLVYAARDKQHNHARVLADYLCGGAGRQ